MRVFTTDDGSDSDFLTSTTVAMRVVEDDYVYGGSVGDSDVDYGSFDN